MELLNEIQNLANSSKIQILGLRNHLKASESYVDVIFKYPELNMTWEGSIPYQYRRRGVFLEKAKDIADYITSVYVSLDPSISQKWADKEEKFWNTNNSGKAVTKEFFFKLLSLKWNCINHDFPANPNWARRIQDIKEMGYLIATDTKKYCDNCKKNTTHLILIPTDKTIETGYETISPKLKERIIKVLGNYDAYEGKVRPSSVLIPDHKFPEISWDEKVKKDNLENLTDDEIKDKFQLMDNQRNLQKREVCRKILQSGKRGELFGIKYYYEGDENWPEDIPKVGVEAEKGWIGSPWYDIEKWRRSLNSHLEKTTKKIR